MDRWSGASPVRSSLLSGRRRLRSAHDPLVLGERRRGSAGLELEPALFERRPAFELETARFERTPAFELETTLFERRPASGLETALFARTAGLRT
jgi:hypothetical protein